MLRIRETGLERNKMENKPTILNFTVQKIISLGHRLKDTDYQIFRDYPAEIINRRRSQMESFKAARKKGIPASFSSSQPDKLYIRGKLWPEGKIFFTS